MDKAKMQKWTALFVKIYIFALVLYQTLWQIVPVRVFLLNTGLDIISPALAVLGFAFLVADVFIEKTVFQSKYCIFLIAVVAIMGISSLLYINYGWIDNAKVIVWQVVQMFLLYSLYLRMDSKQIKIYLGYIFGVVSVIFMMAVIVSLCQFLFQTSYNVQMDGGVYRQGFQEGRLFGIFGNINHASLLMCFMGIGAIYCLTILNKKWLKILMGIQTMLSFIYVVLTGTRSALVCMIFAVILCAFVSMRNIAYKKNFCKLKFRRFICAAGVSIICAGMLFAIYLGVHKVMVKVPVWIGTVNLAVNDNEDLPGDIITEPDRQDINSGDISNNRFKIWKDYLQCDLSNIKSILFGYSPGNYMKIIKDNFPDYYIVEYAQEKYPQAYIENQIYETHNSYLTLLTGTGLVGFVIMGAFLVLSVLSALKCFITRRYISNYAILLMVMLGMILIFNIFESVLFYAYTSISVVFWLMMGILAKETELTEIAADTAAQTVLTCK